MYFELHISTLILMGLGCFIAGLITMDHIGPHL